MMSEAIAGASTTYPMVSLGEVLTQYTEYINAPESKIYPKLSVKLYGKGVTLDDSADGSLLRMKQHQIAKSGQVILSEIWGKKGAIGFVPLEGDGALCTSHFFLFDVDRSKLEPKYLQAIFTANYLENQLNADAKGTTGYAAVRPKHLLAAQIPLPQITEQRRIVARVEELAGKVEEARGLRSESLKRAEAVANAKTTQVFNNLKQYELTSLAKLGEHDTNPIQTGPFGSQLLSSEFVSSGIPVLNVGNIQPQGLKLERLDHVTPEKAQSLTRYSLQADDLLFARTGATLGKVCLLPKGCDGWLMTGHLFRVRLDKSRCDPRFIFVAFRGSEAIKEQVFGQVRGATRPGFNTTLLSAVCLPLPPLSEQHRIVAYLDDLQAKVDGLKQLQAETETELNALLPSILDKAFKGEL